MNNYLAYLISSVLVLYTARGYKLTFRQADDATLTLKKYGEYIYKHLILFSPTTEGRLGLVKNEFMQFYYNLTKP